LHRGVDHLSLETKRTLGIVVEQDVEAALLAAIAASRSALRARRVRVLRRARFDRLLGALAPGAEAPPSSCSNEKTNDAHCDEVFSTHGCGLAGNQNSVHRGLPAWYERRLQLITVLRASAWIAVATAGWSLNLHWGTDALVRPGAPPQFERHVVGAALLAAIAALALAFAGPTRKATRRAAAIAVACAMAAHGIAWWIRSLAISTGQPQLVTGSGWTWLVIGTALATLAALAALRFKAPAAKPKPGSKSRR